MPKSSAERKAAQRARKSAAGNRKMELLLDEQEIEMLEQNCAAVAPLASRLSKEKDDGRALENISHYRIHRLNRDSGKHGGRKD